MSFVLWYSTVPFQCRKVRKLIARVWGWPAFWRCVCVERRKRNACHQRREMCGQSFSECYSTCRLLSKKAVASGAGFPFQALFWRLFVESRCLSDRSGILGACLQQDPRSLSSYLLERLGLETYVLQSPSHRVSDEVSFD